MPFREIFEREREIARESIRIYFLSSLIPYEQLIYANGWTAMLISAVILLRLL